MRKNYEYTFKEDYRISLTIKINPTILQSAKAGIHTLKLEFTNCISPYDFAEFLKEKAFNNITINNNTLIAQIPTFIICEYENDTLIIKTKCIKGEFKEI